MVENLGVKRYPVTDASGVWRQNSLTMELSDAGNEDAQIALLHIGPIMKHTGYMEKTTVKKMQDCQYKSMLKKRC